LVIPWLLDIKHYELAAKNYEQEIEEKGGEKETKKWEFFEKKRKSVLKKIHHLGLMRSF